ncbi:MAG: glycerol kinase [SAR116 cluster bacterium]|nr:glycerol kinase [SAR116 cluster bacterium]
MSNPVSKDFILAIDQGTTSTRAIVFDQMLTPIATAQQEFDQHFPQSGWVEHDAEDLWSTTVAMCQQAIARANITAKDIAAIGITNQRETTVVWDRHTGAPLYRAIVWQDRRTAEFCKQLQEAGHEAMVTAKTGLLLDPYFSATKLSWILNNVEGARARAEAGDLLFGTVDSYLIWRLTGGKAHVTDATNAARTMMYNIIEGSWDSELLNMLDIPAHMLPEVRDSSGLFGTTEPDFFDGVALPIMGVAGDQQAATVGQACFASGMMKSTYGTGCFALMNTGEAPVFSSNKLLTTIAYQLDGKPTYALEGSIFIAGAVVQWLRDGLKIISSAAETEALAQTASPTEQVYMVPAFTGLGAPYWNTECRGAIFGLTRNTGPAEFAKAALESVAYQTRDLVEAMRADWSGERSGESQTVLRIDGGMVANDWAMQTLANQLLAPVDRPVVTETTASGAAYLAGLAQGICAPPDEFAKNWRLERRFEPQLSAEEADKAYAGWQDAIAKLLH